MAEEIPARTLPPDARVRAGHTTAEAFFDLADSAPFMELINGEVIMGGGAIPEHQKIVGNLYVLLRQIKPHGEVFIAPLSVYLDPENVPEPDVIWVAEGGRCVVADKRLEGPPDLLVEVLSPSTAKYDKDEKFRLYERHGVREYWIADPANRYIEVWVLIDGVYQRQGIYEAGDTFTSPALDGRPVELRSVFE